MMAVSGKINHLQKYANAKLLDHSSWNLPRCCTGSDIDMVLEDSRYGRILIVELSSQWDRWDRIKKPQRLVYARFVATGTGRIIAVLARHRSTGTIDTLRDVDSFQVMFFASLMGYCTSPVLPGARWNAFVQEFYKGNRFSSLQKHGSLEGI